LSDYPRLTDQIGIIGLDASPYDDHGTHHTTVDIDNLKTAFELLDVLGWDTIDVCTVESTDETPDHSLLVFRPPRESLFSGDQAGVAIAPLTDHGRQKVSSSKE